MMNVIQLLLSLFATLLSLLGIVPPPSPLTPPGVEQTFTSGGTTSTYRVLNGDASGGTLLWLHGDGFFEYDHPDSPEYVGGDSGLLATAMKHNVRLIIPKTPSRDGTWWTDGDRTAAWVCQLMTTQPGPHRTAGFSGGSELISYFLLPSCPTGDAVMFGGGGTESGFPARTPSTGAHLTWIVGERDTGWDDDGFDAVQASAEGQRTYRSWGWDTTRHVIPGKSHILSDNGVGLYGELLDQVW